MGWSTSRIRLVAVLVATPGAWAAASWAWYSTAPNVGVQAVVLGQGVALAAGWPVVTVRAMFGARDGEGLAHGWRRTWQRCSSCVLVVGVLGLAGASGVIGAETASWDTVRRGTLVEASVVQFSMGSSESSDPEFGGVPYYRARLQDPVDGTDLGWVGISRDDYGRRPVAVYVQRGAPSPVVRADRRDEGPVVLRWVFGGSAGLELLVLGRLVTRPRRRT